MKKAELSVVAREKNKIYKANYYQKNKVLISAKSRKRHFNNYVKAVRNTAEEKDKIKFALLLESNDITIEFD